MVKILDLYPMLFCSVVVYVAAAQTRGGECRDIEWCHLHAVLSVNISLTDEVLFFFERLDNKDKTIFKTKSIFIRWHYIPDDE